MPVQVSETQEEIRLPGVLAALNSTTVGVVCYTPSGAGLSPTQQATAIIRKIWAYNNSGAQQDIQLGTGTGTFVQRMPALSLANGSTTILTEEDIPAVEFTAAITGIVSAGVGPVSIMIEVGERQGATGHNP